MSNQIDLWEIPKAKEIYMIAGWRQWVDGGAISSGLPRYLIKKLQARQIGKMQPDNFYIFQIPGMQQYIRPIVRHQDGLTKSLHTQRNEFYYTEIDGKGLVIFIGDEPHINAEQYSQTLLSVARQLKVKKIILLGGIYAEVPYDKERYVTSIFSQPHLKEELSDMATDLSNYQGPGSIGSFLCNRAGKYKMDLVGFYSFSPIFQFSQFETVSETIHIENDYRAWLGSIRRINHMLGININLEDLEQKSDQLTERIKKTIEKLDVKYPDLAFSDYAKKLSDDFEENIFSPLGDIWQDELRRLGDEFFPADE